MRYFNCHTHAISNKEGVLDLLNQYPQEFNAKVPFYSIGIHPWHIVKDRVGQDLEVIEEKLQLTECLALGECGLDKRIEIPIELQLSVFEQQLLLAEKYKKPVIIHCVAAFQEVIAIKKELKITVPLLIHGFSKNNLLAKQLLDNEFYLSFGKYLLRNPDLKEVFQQVPLDRFFLETDTVDESIEEVYALASKYKEIEVADLQVIIEANFKKVFQKSF